MCANRAIVPSLHTSFPGQTDIEVHGCGGGGVLDQRKCRVGSTALQFQQSKPEHAKEISRRLCQDLGVQPAGIDEITGEALPVASSSNCSAWSCLKAYPSVEVFTPVDVDAVPVNELNALC